VNIFRHGGRAYQPHPLFKGFIAAAHARLHQKPA
jgi:hypothetical protein